RAAGGRLPGQSRPYNVKYFTKSQTFALAAISLDSGWNQTQGAKAFHARLSCVFRIRAICVFAQSTTIHSDAAMSAVEVRNVTKRFGTLTAVNGVSLDVPDGSIFGFIGPNGSGKTTTIRMIMNILLPDEGEILVFNRHSHSSVRDDVGYLPEERGLYKRMTVRRVLRYYGQLKGRSLFDIDPMITKWLGRLQLADWADKKVQ